MIALPYTAREAVLAPSNAEVTIKNVNSKHTDPSMQIQTRESEARDWTSTISAKLTMTRGIRSDN